MYEYKARITRVIDGDTVQATISLGFHLTSTHRLRLLGIDTPERGQDGYAEATARLVELIEQHEDDEGYILIRTAKDDSFGRWLANLVGSDGVTLNERMVEEGFAKVYQPKG